MIWTSRVPGGLMRACLAAAVAALALGCAQSAAAATIDAHGSSEQVYATGLSAGERRSVVDGAGRTAATRPVNRRTGTRPSRSEYGGDGYAGPPAEGGAESSIELLANIMGFTVVDVNMRGTGCSGGAFDFFERNQSLDGYDVIETIAHL